MGAIHSEIILPQESDAVFSSRELLWNAVEAAEKRKDAQLAKSLLLALPIELNHEQQIHLVKLFSQQYFISCGIPVDINLYDKQDGNPFAYILFTTRKLCGNKLDSHKARDLNPGFGKGFVMKKDYWGKRWGEFQSSFFTSMGIQAEVKEEDIIPQIHEGPIDGPEKSFIKQENKLRKSISESMLKNAKR